jgi:broad specificity phosphatase PhoE
MCPEASKGHTERVEAHQSGEVADLVLQLRAMKTKLPRGRWIFASRSPTPEAIKTVHFIRHGEGRHNVAQREWRAYNNPGEPYTVDNDATGRYADAQLTTVGESQAKELVGKVASPDLIVVSPLRRAVQTALLAFPAPRAKVLAVELCHEIGGKHTCDKRLSKSELARQFPEVDFALLSEEDPLWGDGLTRESLDALSSRAREFMEWLITRPEKEVVVASHSTFLLTLFNTALDWDDEYLGTWFGTGEMRSVHLSVNPGEALGVEPPRRCKLADGRCTIS